MGDVQQLRPAFDPDVVLEKAKGEFSQVIIIGWRKDNKDLLDTRASLGLTNQDVLWLVERTKYSLMQLGESVD